MKFGALFLLLCVGVSAGEKEKVKFTPVANERYTTRSTVEQSAKPGTARTTCTDRGTANQVTDCVTTVEGAKPAQTDVYEYMNMKISGTLTKPNGEKYEVTVWCKQALRRCRPLHENEEYTAELAGSNLWVQGTDALTNKAWKIKYHIIDAKKIAPQQ